MTNSKKRLVLIATHKPCVLPTESLYLPVHCGRAVSQLNTSALHWMESHTIGDNTGDNISDLQSYSKPLKDGYTFTGWYTSKVEDPYAGKFDDLTSVNRDLDLYPHWIIDSSSQLI